MIQQGTEKYPGVSIFHRLLLGFIGISLFIILIMGSVYYFYAKERVAQIEKKEIEHLLLSAISYFNNTYKNVILGDLTLLESVPSLDNFLTVSPHEQSLIRFDLEKMFFRLTKVHSNLYRAISFFDVYGDEKIIIKDQKRIRNYSSIFQYQQQNNPINHGVSLLFNKLKEAAPGNILFEGPFKDAENRYIFVVGISKREPEIAGFGGVIMFHCDLTDFVTYLAEIKVFDTPVAWLYTDNGHTLVSPPGYKKLTDPRPHLEMAEEKYLGVDKLTIHYHDYFIHCNGCILGSGNSIFKIVLSFPPDIFAKLMKDILVRALMVIAIVLIVAGIISYILAKQFAKPIIELSKASQLLSRGELSEASLFKGGGEIGALSRSFYIMAKKLQELLEKRNQEIFSRKQAEKLLQKAHDDLEQRVEERTLELRKTHELLLHAEKLSAIGGLSASIAHEFNNPLQGIMTVIKGVKRRVPLDEEDAQLVNMAISECDRMKNLIKSLQDFNRPSSGRVAPMNIPATIDSLLLLSKNEFKTKGITFETNYAQDMPQVKAVADQIKQVILNLLNNAGYACEQGGKIAINTEISKENIFVQIKDNGKGIKPEHMDQIFDPFFTTKPEIKGTGLGLSISYGIIKKHGGIIEVKSDPGKGAAFTLTLPIDGAKNAK